MKKLELKHLAPYLPYKPELFCVKDCKPHNWIYKGQRIQLGMDSINQTLAGNLKPILRPLSDLAKTKFYDGGKNFSSEWWKRQLESGTSEVVLNILTFNDAQWVLKDHYDIFNLIPEGLAIDINTI